MEKLSNDPHNDLVQRLNIGFNALLEQVQDLELQLSRIRDEDQDLLRPESPLTYSSSLNSFHSHQNGFYNDTNHLPAKQLNSVDSHQAIRLKNRSQEIWEGRQALEALNASSFSNMPISGSKDFQYSQPNTGRYEAHNSKPAAHSLKDLDPKNPSRCPFSSANKIPGDPKATWPSYESITPRPNSVTIPQAHQVETAPSLHGNASPDQQRINASDSINSSCLDHQERSSHHHDPMSSTHRESSIQDPIAAESRPPGCCPPPSASGSASASKCPIRYIDQHSPQEIAAYFENHKHEVPRSHEICVKRYQSSAQSIRQLDAKYGDLVSMIQGLGMKHQPLLPTDDDEEIPAAEQNLLERVEKWTDEIRQTPEKGKAEEAPPDTRENHFDRPLKDVRLGESPSRPWGISVPTAATPSKAPTSPTSTRHFSPDNITLHQDKDTHSNSHSPVPQNSHPHLSSPTPNPTTTPPFPFHCPNPHCADNPPIIHFPSPSQQQQPSPKSSSHPSPSQPSQQPPQQQQPSHPQPGTTPAPAPAPQIIFSGPVFIGYSLDQVALAMRGGFFGGLFGEGGERGGGMKGV